MRELFLPSILFGLLIVAFILQIIACFVCFNQVTLVMSVSAFVFGFGICMVGEMLWRIHKSSPSSKYS